MRRTRGRTLGGLASGRPTPRGPTHGAVREGRRRVEGEARAACGGEGWTREGGSVVAEGGWDRGMGLGEADSRGRGRTHGGKFTRGKKVGTHFCLHFILFSSRDKEEKKSSAPSIRSRGSAALPSADAGLPPTSRTSIPSVHSNSIPRTSIPSNPKQRRRIFFVSIPRTSPQIAPTVPPPPLSLAPLRQRCAPPEIHAASSPPACPPPSLACGG
jgi:hypothetical protein